MQSNTFARGHRLVKKGSRPNVSIYSPVIVKRTHGSRKASLPLWHLHAFFLLPLDGMRTYQQTGVQREDIQYKPFHATRNRHSTGCVGSRVPFCLAGRPWVCVRLERLLTWKPSLMSYRPRFSMRPKPPKHPTHTKRWRSEPHHMTILMTIQWVQQSYMHLEHPTSRMRTAPTRGTIIREKNVLFIHVLF